MANHLIWKVRQAMEDGEIYSIDPIQGYVVNFEPTSAYPKMFIYLACNWIGNNNRTCQKTIEGPNRCHHDSLEKRTWMDALKFDVIFVDGSINLDYGPLQMDIFKATKDILM